jgi:predicted secreted protein
VGDQIKVTLPETATTGFAWQPNVDGGTLRQVGDERAASAVPRGAPGTRVITFEALRPGEALLRLVKRRPWEAKPADEFSVELQIEPSEG